MASSKSYKDLAWAWKAWRDAVGRTAKPDYVRKVEIQKEIAEANGEWFDLTF